MRNVELRTLAERWLDAEPDDDMRAELAALLAGDEASLAERFGGTLQFGTAGLRAAVGAGPLRMNRLVVRQAAAGLADHLLATEPDVAQRGVIIGHDARRKSDDFAGDSARVFAARGIPVTVLAGPQPTPLLSWTMLDRGFAAGIVVTASHNPAADNGYKVYLGDGPQIVSPVDAQIAACIAAVDPTTVPLAEPDDRLIGSLADDAVNAYVRFAASVRHRPEVTSVPIAYTPMHGVGGPIAMAVFEAAGFERPAVVESQWAPDPAFPTVAFPNPEEPGAMDRVIELAQSTGAVLAIANDPDADRLGAAIPQADGSWRRLGGNEIGWLLADHVLAHTTGDDRLVVTTVVSSSQLAQMADRHGVHFLETFTGFKYIGRAALDHPEWRLVFAYEQALGYLVAARPLDKDGITAALLLAEIAAVAAAEGRTIQDHLDALAVTYGRHLIDERSIRMPPAAGVARVDALVTSPPGELAGVAVERMTPFPAAGLVRFDLANGVRVQVRPSGTEPKVKLYGEGVDVDPGPFLEALAELIEP